MADWTTPSAIHSKCGQDVDYPATNTIDENTATFWRHYTTEYHWIIFDMGETKKITQIRLYVVGSSQAFGLSVGLYVYVGDDPENLGAAVWEGVLNVANQWNLSGTFDKNGRYVKLLSKSNSALQRMYEFDAMAEAVAGGPIERAVTESLGSISDDTTQLLQRDRQISESSISASDGVSAEKFVPLVERNVSEPSISIADSPVYTLRRDRALSEPTIVVSDGVVSIFWGFRMISEPVISVSDALSAGLVRSRSVSEIAISVSDGTSYVFQRGRVINESSISISDVLSVAINHVVSVSEPTISVSDVVYAGIFGKLVKVKIFLIIGDLAIQLTGA